jgi:ABC-type polysaccharide/polyol phosphate transport system ATPase subunit
MNSHLQLKNVCVDYPIFNIKDRTITSNIFSKIGGKIGSREDKHVSVRSLNNISIELQKGDRLGLVGGNGAGKSTLLRTMAGILSPTDGIVDINGNVSTILEMSNGMDNDATGYENIISRLIYLGLTFAEAKNKIEEIESFCELGEFLSLPMSTYSSGMAVRLAFAISTSITPNILIIDEILSVGDASFISKAQDRMKSLMLSSEIIVLAAHDMHVLKEVCNKGIYLKNGEIKFSGNIEDVIKKYESDLY